MSFLNKNKVTINSPAKSNTPSTPILPGLFSTGGFWLLKYCSKSYGSKYYSTSKPLAT